MIKTSMNKHFIPKIFLFLLLFAFSLQSSAKSEDIPKESYKWKQLSGKWVLQNDSNVNNVTQQIIPTSQWKYNLPTNYHSLSSITGFNSYSTLSYSLEVKNPRDSIELLLFFAAEFSTRSRYHDLYAFNFAGDKVHFNKVTFLKSSVIEPEQLSKSNNFKIDELSTANCDILLDQKNRYDIKINRNTVTLYINGKQIHTHKAVDRLDQGFIGIGIKNSQLKVYEVKVFDGRKPLFHDDFSKDSIKVFKAVVQKVSNEEFERIKREEDKKRKK